MGNNVVSRLSFSGGEVGTTFQPRVDMAKYSSSCAQLKNFLPSVYGKVSRRRGLKAVGTTGLIHDSNQIGVLIPFQCDASNAYICVPYYSTETFRYRLAMYRPTGGWYDVKARQPDGTLVTFEFGVEDALVNMSISQNDKLYVLMKSGLKVITRTSAPTYGAHTFEIRAMRYQFPPLRPSVYKDTTKYKEATGLALDTGHTVTTYLHTMGGVVRFGDGVNNFDPLAAVSECPVAGSEGVYSQLLWTKWRATTSQLTDTLNSAPYQREMQVFGEWNFQTYGNWKAKLEIWRTTYEIIEHSTNPGELASKAKTEMIYSWDSRNEASDTGQINVQASGYEPTPCTFTVKVVAMNAQTGADNWSLTTSEAYQYALLYSPQTNNPTRSYRVLIPVANQLGATVDGTVVLPIESPVEVSEAAFSHRRGWEKVFTIHRDRFWVSGGGNPQSLWASEVDNYENYFIGSKDADAMQINLSGETAKEIKWMISGKDLFVGTTGGEWIISPQGQGALSPSNVQAYTSSNHGTSAIPGVMLGEGIAFLSNDNKRLRVAGFNYEVDGWEATSLNDLHPEILESQAVDMSVTRNPDTRLYLPLGNGHVAVLVYSKVQQVSAWAHWDFGTKIYAACAVSIDGKDYPMFMAYYQNGQGSAALCTLDDESVLDLPQEVEVQATPVNTPVSLYNSDAVDWYDGRKLIQGVDYTQVRIGGNIITSFGEYFNGRTLTRTPRSECVLETLPINGQDVMSASLTRVFRCQLKLQTSNIATVTATGEPERDTMVLDVGINELTLGGGIQTDGTITVKLQDSRPCELLGLNVFYSKELVL